MPRDRFAIDPLLYPESAALIEAAKHEHAQSLRNALLRARIKIMADEVFPAHREWKEAA